MQDIGFIGLGVMGKPMALRMLAAGYRLHCFSRSGTPPELVTNGAYACASAREAAERADILITMLPDTPDVEAVMFSHGNAAEGLRPGAAVVDMSTICPEATRRFAALTAERGCEWMDAPVSGGDVGANAGTLSIMAGGSPELFERVKPLLACMGQNISLIGGVGTGQTTKLVNQIIVALNVEAVAEGLAFAEKAGVDPEKVRQALAGGFAGSRVLEVHGERMIAGRFAPGFRVELHQKDLRLVLKEAQRCGASVPHTASVSKMFDACDGKEDNSALIRVLREGKV